MYKTIIWHHNSKHCDIVKNPDICCYLTFVIDADDDGATFFVERRQLHVLWHLWRLLSRYPISMLEIYLLTYWAFILDATLSWYLFHWLSVDVFCIRVRQYLVQDSGAFQWLLLFGLYNGPDMRYIYLNYLLVVSSYIYIYFIIITDRCMWTNKAVWKKDGMELNKFLKFILFLFYTYYNVLDYGGDTTRVGCADLCCRRRSW